MSSPSRRELSRAIVQLLDTQSAEKVAKSLAAYLIAERRTKEVDLLMRDIESFRYRQTGASEVTVVSAHELSEALKNEIASLFNADKASIHTSIDPSVVGGARIRTLDRQLDMTVQSKLKKLKNLTA